MVHERKKFCRQTTFWHIFFCLSLLGFATLYASKLVFKKENTLGIYSQKSWLSWRLPFCSHIKTCAGHPQSCKTQHPCNNFWFLQVWKAACCDGICTSCSISSTGSCAVKSKRCVLPAEKRDSEAPWSFSSRERWLGHPQISVYSRPSYLHCIPVRPKLPVVQIPFQPQFLLQYDFPTSLFPSLVPISTSF